MAKRNKRGKVKVNYQNNGNTTSPLERRRKSAETFKQYLDPVVQNGKVTGTKFGELKDYLPFRVAYLVNCLLVARVGGEAESYSETKVISEIALELGASASGVGAALFLVSDDDSVRQFQNLYQAARCYEDMLLVAFCDGTCDDAEKSSLINYGLELGIDDFQVHALVDNARNKCRGNR